MRSRFFAGLALGAALCLPAGGQALSEDQTQSTAVGINAVFGSLGVNEKRNLNKKTCIVTVDFDQNKILESAPLLQKLGILNDEFTISDLRSKPVRTTLAFAMLISSISTKSAYDDDKDIDKCNFIYSMIFQDEYGNDDRAMMFSYEFNRSTYNRVNWDKFQSVNIIKVSKGFKFNSEIAAKAEKE